MSHFNPERSTSRENADMVVWCSPRLDPARVWGAKARGIMACAELGLPVPEAMMIALSEHWREEIDGVTDAVCDFHRGLGPALTAFRCDAKHSGGNAPDLPETVLNLGLAGVEIALLGHNLDPARLRATCDNHADAFFEDVGTDKPKGFAVMPFRDQATLWLRCFYQHLESLTPAQQKGGSRAVVLQRMVFGTGAPGSLTGMCYTRHPHSGVAMDYGHFIPDRQGMSLGGVDSPQQRDLAEMKAFNPEAYQTLRAACRTLETHYGDIRCLEYTAQGPNLFLLQNTVGNRTFRIKPDGGES